MLEFRGEFFAPFQALDHGFPCYAITAEKQGRKAAESRCVSADTARHFITVRRLERAGSRGARGCLDRFTLPRAGVRLNRVWRCAVLSRSRVSRFKVLRYALSIRLRLLDPYSARRTGFRPCGGAATASVAYHGTRWSRCHALGISARRCPGPTSRRWCRRPGRARHRPATRRSAGRERRSCP